MKRLIAALSLLFALQLSARATVAGSGGWRWLNPLPQGNYISSVACAGGGPCYAAGSNGMVLITHNRGMTWTNLPSGTPADFFSIACPSGPVCYALSQGTIFTTRDGAQTWSAHHLNATWFLSRLSCSNSRTCYALGGDERYQCHVPNCILHGKENVLVRTMDGGNTWQRLQTGDTGGLYGIACPVTRTCYLAGENGTVLVTRNGGARWQAAARGTVPSNVTLRTVACLSTSQCFVGGDGVLLATGSYGKTWTMVAAPPGIHFGFTDLTCANAGGCLGLGSSQPPQHGLYQAILVALSMLGNNPRATVRGIVAGTSISCSDPHDCHVAGGPTSPSSSQDGGRHWQAWIRGDREDLYRITCPTILSCRAVGRGAMLTTDNAGATWIRRGPIVGDDYGNGSGLLCLDPAYCFATRSFGRILITHDGGRTWQSRRNPATGTAVEFSGISCPSRTVCFTIGAGCKQDPCRPGEQARSIVLTTNNAGTTWRRILARQGQFLHLNAIACPSQTVCYVTGSPAIVLVTRDGGLKWQEQRSPLGGTSTDLQSITCTGTQVCYAVGYGCATSYGCVLDGLAGSILHTTNGGRTWQRVIPPLSQQARAKTCSVAGCPEGPNLNAIDCLSPQNCWTVGSLGTILHTRDGGATWQNDPSGTDINLRGISCVTRTLPGAPRTSPRCYAVGEGGVILGLTSGASSAGRLHVAAG